MTTVQQTTQPASTLSTITLEQVRVALSSEVTAALKLVLASGLPVEGQNALKRTSSASRAQTTQVHHARTRSASVPARPSLVVKSEAAKPDLQTGALKAVPDKTPSENQSRSLGALLRGRLERADFLQRLRFTPRAWYVPKPVIDCVRLVCGGQVRVVELTTLAKGRDATVGQLLDHARAAGWLNTGTHAMCAALYMNKCLSRSTLLRDVPGLRDGSTIHTVCEAYTGDAPKRPAMLPAKKPAQFARGTKVVVEGVGPAVIDRVRWVQQSGAGDGGYVKQQNVKYLEGANASGSAPSAGLKLIDTDEFAQQAKLRGWRSCRGMPDCLHFEGDDTEKAMMYCGHAFSYSAMRSYVQQCSGAGAKDMYITCPACRLELEPAQCVDIANRAVEADDEKQSDVPVLWDIESTLTMRASINDMNTGNCPKCDQLLFKSGKSNGIKVKCASCEATPFCWHCKGPWKEDCLGCGNASCSSSQEAIKTTVEILEKCPRVSLDGRQDVPKYRACPKCSILIEHKQDCKHMTCGRNGHAGPWVKKTGCRHQFCFVCLQDWEGHESAKCQTHLPQDMKTLPESIWDRDGKKSTRVPDLS